MPAAACQSRAWLVAGDTKREPAQLGAKKVVEMDGPSTFLTNPLDAEAEPKQFTFDYSYDWDVREQRVWQRGVTRSNAGPTPFLVSRADYTRPRLWRPWQAHGHSGF